MVTEQQRLTINAHLGTEVTYHWFFGNGDEYVSQDNYANYTWMDDGVYNITLRAYNDISQDIYEVGGLCAALFTIIFSKHHIIKLGSYSQIVARTGHTGVERWAPLLRCTFA